MDEIGSDTTTNFSYLVVNAEFAQSCVFLLHLHRFSVGHVNVLVALSLARAIVAGPHAEVEQPVTDIIRFRVGLRSGTIFE